jgi:flavodoxin
MEKLLMSVFIALLAVGSVSAQTNAGTRKIIVVYFSWSGNTRNLAQQIHQKVGGDIFEIVTVNAYPTNYNACVNQAQDEQRRNFRPPLKSSVENMAQYNTVFIGYPNWWGTMPMALFTFLESYNFSGKTIIPFCTSEGSGLGRGVSDIKKIAPAATMLEGFTVRGGSVRNAQRDVDTWLNKIGIIAK